MPKNLSYLTALACLCLISTAVFGQKFMQSAGATISLMHTRGTFDGTTQSFNFTLSNVTYFPRLNIMEAENSSVSVGLPIGVGIGMSSNYGSGTRGVYYGIDLPAVIDYNIGAKSTNDNEQKFGGYFGSGFGYTYSNWDFGGYGTVKANSYGPLLRGGLRFGFPTSGTNLGLTIGLYYKTGLETEKYKTYGMNVLFDF